MRDRRELQAEQIVDALLCDDTVSFRGRQLDLLRRYRRVEEEQGPLSAALISRLERSVASPKKQRLEETLDLLDHVCDPLIG